MSRSYLVLVSLVALLLPVAAQRRPPTTENVPKQLTIRVTYESGHPVDMGIRVQLQNGTGTPIGETFTDDRGNVTFMVETGSYRVRISGPTIDDTSSERSFFVDSRESNHIEFFNVRRKPEAEAANSTQGHVSAAMLQIPDKARSECEKGTKALDNKDFEKAKQHLQKATEIYPKYAEAFNALGVLAMNTGDAETGKLQFEKAIAADPEYPAAFVNLSKIKMQQKDFVGGEEIVGKAVSLDPMNAEAISLLAFFELQTGKLEAAVAAAERVHQLPHARFAMVHFVAGNAYEQRQRIPDAIRQYKLYLDESPPDSPTAQRVRAVIETLEARPR